MNFTESAHPPSDDYPAWLDRLATAVEPFRHRGIVVAVSGGGDSVALLRGLVAVQHRDPFRLSVATMDHSTRGGGSGADCAFVADLARQFSLPFNLGHWRSERASHFEADARRARYAWLIEGAQQRGAGAVAVGHNRDDQAETILHRIVRGTGLRGLGGMATRRALAPGVALIRPLLTVPRDDLRAYLTALGQSWREDITNQDQTRTRARIRHDLLPRLARDYNPAVAEAVIRLGEVAALAAAAADHRVTRHLRQVTIDADPEQITLDRRRLIRLTQGDRVALIRLGWRRAGWPERSMTHARWLRLAALAVDQPPGRLDVIGGVAALATTDHWTLIRSRPSRPTLPPAMPPRLLAIPGEVAWFEGVVEADLSGEVDPAAHSEANPLEEWVDRNRVVEPCLVRSSRPGDRFDPLGMGGRSQPLADFFRGRGVAQADRRRVPVVCDERGIIWVAGHRISDRVRRTATTEQVLRLRYCPNENPEQAQGP